MSFDREVDMLYAIDLVGDLPTVKSRFDDLAELVNERANQPKGNIEDGPWHDEDEQTTKKG